MCVNLNPNVKTMNESDNYKTIINIKCANIGELNNKLDGSEKNNILAVSFNAQSCANLSAFDDIKYFLGKCKKRIDIVIISETWFKADQCGLYEMRGYKAIHDCRKGRRGGGLSMYIHNNWNICDAQLGILDTCNSIKASIVSRNATTKLTAVGIYRPPLFDSTNTKKFLQSFEDLLSSTVTDCCLIGGDMNIDVDKNNSLVRNYNHLILSYGFRICNSNTTRTDSGTRIDHIIANFSGNHDITIATVASSFSDHEILVAAAAMDRQDTELDCRQRRSFTDYDKMRSELVRVLQSQYPVNSDVNTQYGFIKNSILNSKRISTTLTLLSPRHSSTSCPWIDNCPVICTLKREKQQAWRRYKRSNRSNLNIRDKLKRLTNLINAAKSKAKATYFHDQFAQCSNSKQTWKTISNVLQIKGKKESICQVKIGVNTTSNKNEIANEAAYHFATVGNKLANRIAKHPNDHPNKLCTLTTCTNSIFMNPTDENEVKNLILSLDGKKARGIDGVDANTLKQCANEVAPVLADLINICIAQGQYPDELKVARVIPIHKSGRKDDLDNYRPISVLPMMNKIVERIIYNRLVHFLDRNKFFHHAQFGFRKGMSTRLATSEIINRMYIEMDKKRAASGLFMDLSKAFDCVSHPILIHKLERAGIRGNALSLCESYFQARKIIVEIDDERSHEHVVTLGVGQGSILGPLFYLIYVNDIGKLQLTGNLSLFADDTAIFYYGPTHEHNKIAIQRDMSVIEEYYRLNGLTSNRSKTQFIHFGNRRGNLNPVDSIQCNETVIFEANTVKYLGLVLDNRLNWKPHIDRTSSKIAGPIGMITKLSAFLPTKILLLIYFSLVHSHLSYLTIIWACARRRHRRPAEVLQNRALRRCLKKNNRFNTMHLYQQCNVLPLRGIRDLQLCQCIRNTLATPTNNTSSIVLSHPSLQRPRRQPAMLSVPRIHSYYGECSINYRAPILYNDTLRHINQHNRTETNFKTNIKKELLRNEHLRNLIY